MAVEIFANQPSTTVTSGGTTAPASGTTESWTVASSSPFPVISPGVTQFHVADIATGLQSEIIAVTSVSGTTWTVTRGAESTVPVAHAGGFTITQVVTAGALGDFPPVFNVMTYGATGNGTTDDTAAIQAAMNAAGPTGGTVSFPPGNYLVSSTLLWKPAAGGLTNQAFYAPSLIGAGQGATAPRFGTYSQGATQITASSSFTTGEFLIDYIGDTGANNCIAGYEISGLSLQCSSRAAGLRNCNAHSSVIRRITINSAATPSPANTIGSPAGAMSAVASPTTNAWNNHYEDIMAFGAAQDGFYLFEGSGSYVMAGNCVAGNAGRYGFNAGDGSVLTGCSSQAAVTADFQVWYSTLIGCNNEPWISGGCKGNALFFTGNNNRQANVIGGTFNGNSNASVTGEAAALINFPAGGETFDVVMTGVNFKTGSHTSYWLYSAGTGALGKFQLNGCSFNTAGGALVTGTYNILTALSGTFQAAFKNCPGLNPFGTQTVAVPLTTVATAGLPFDSTYYITAGSTSCTVAISGGPTITIPGSALATVRVPAGQTLTPVYTNAPTWVVEGE